MPNRTLKLIPLKDWQRRAFNAFGLAPVYLSLATTADQLILSAPRGFILDREHAERLRQLNLRATTRDESPTHFQIVIQPA